MNEPEQTPDPSAEELARRVASQSGIHRGANGEVDVLKTVGGVRGLIETLLPGLVFLVVFTATQALDPSLIASLAIAAVFTAVRLIQRTPLTQALSGLIGVAVCALVSRSTGEARDYYVVGFYTNAAYLAALVASILVRWPLMGLVFGFIRGEGVAWRAERTRRVAYALATWVIVAVFGARLLVQLPLYFADNVAALGAARIVMGVPLYAMGLWLAWLFSKPQRAATAGGPSDGTGGNTGGGTGGGPGGTGGVAG